MLWPENNLSISSGKQTHARAAKSWGTEEMKSSYHLSQTLLPCLVLLATHAWLLSERLLVGCYGFHFCERLLRCHHNGWLNSKRTHTPKSICEALTSPLALDIWARVDEIAHTFLFSQKDLFKGYPASRVALISPPAVRRWRLREILFKQYYCHPCDTRFAIFYPLPSYCIRSLFVRTAQKQKKQRNSAKKVPQNFVTQHWNE